MLFIFLFCVPLFLLFLFLVPLFDEEPRARRPREGRGVRALDRAVESAAGRGRGAL